MKNINVTFEDSEFKKLEKGKGKMSWKAFIIYLLELKNG